MSNRLPFMPNKPTVTVDSEAALPEPATIGISVDLAQKALVVSRLELHRKSFLSVPGSGLLTQRRSQYFT